MTTTVIIQKDGEEYSRIVMPSTHEKASLIAHITQEMCEQIYWIKTLGGKQT